jgi:hypothetical protein
VLWCKSLLLAEWAILISFSRSIGVQTMTSLTGVNVIQVSEFEEKKKAERNAEISTSI